MEKFLKVEVLSAPLRLDKKVEVMTQGGIFHVARILNKPILEIQKGEISQMGLPEENTYYILAVLDGDIIYLYRRKIKSKKG